MSAQWGAVRTIEKAETCSIKRLAWAFGCAKKGSDEELQLYRLLVERIATLRAEREELSGG